MLILVTTKNNQVTYIKLPFDENLVQEFEIKKDLHSSLFIYYQFEELYENNIIYSYSYFEE